MDAKEYVKWYGQVAATTTRLCKTAGMECLDRIVSMYF